MVVSYNLEVRSAEGGDDAKQFVSDMRSAYVRAFDSLG